MRPPPNTSADYIDHGGYQADMAAEQRRCVSRSKDHGHHIEQETHTRRSTGQCGRVALLSDTRNPGTHAAARLPCKRRGSCPDCGPVTRQAIIRHFLAMMEGHPMRRRRIDPAARRSTLAKLRRAGHQWVPIPAPDGALALYATGGPGDVVDDLEASLTSDVMAAPDGRAITPCRAWARQPAATRGTGRWKLDGMVKVPLAQLIRAAVVAGYYRGQVAAEALPPDWAEAHLLQQPDDELAWQRFRRRIGLHWPERHKRRRAA